MNTSKINLETCLREARRIAQQAGSLLLSRFEVIREMEFKGEINPVTVMDGLSERLITESLQKLFPEHGIIAEEGTAIEAKSEFTWVIDPLDGTTNYAHGFPFFCTSIALLEEGVPVVGVIHAPKLGEEFHALRGRGAFLNNAPITVSKETNLGRSFLTMGVPYDVRDKIDYHVGLFKKFIQKGLAIRRAGSACLDLSYVACGRFDGYWEVGLKPWDVAAGMLLIQEAGGKVTDFEGQPYAVNQSGTLLATNGVIHPSMLEVIKI